jgi:hypothetical protein
MVVIPFSRSRRIRLLADNVGVSVALRMKSAVS